MCMALFDSLAEILLSHRNFSSCVTLLKYVDDVWEEAASFVKYNLFFLVASYEATREMFCNCCNHKDIKICDVKSTLLMSIKNMSVFLSLAKV